MSLDAPTQPLQPLPTPVPAVAPAVVDPGPPEPAGFWTRFAALVIDGMVLGMASWVVFIVVTIAMGISAAALGDAIDGASAAIGFMLVGWLLIFAMSWVYFSFQESSSAQASLGKRAVGLYVADGAGARIGLGRATGRWFAHALSNVTLCIGYLIQPFTPRRQALHDLVSGTVVMRKPGSNNVVTIIVLAVCLPLVGIAVIGILAAIAIPQYAEYVKRAEVKGLEAESRQLLTLLVAKSASSGEMIATLDELDRGFTPAPSTQIEFNDYVVIITSTKPRLDGYSVVLSPVLAEDGSVRWHCQTTPLEKFDPAWCRQLREAINA
ncbi:RDD family protein [Chitinolyticbacter albus]|uniref:RDD family protein n=1 Tax=Chitinolyticbacter albus TaxID=2961951 RepID=UPI00210BFD58|nr:RDD family protein [Chitinolyticbacter albus]